VEHAGADDPALAQEDSMAPTRSFVSTLTGSFSTPAADNPTVAMVEAAYRALGLDARYLNCDVQPEDLGDAVRGARAMGWAGFNCSLPHKVAVVEHLDRLAGSAQVIGAVNCVVREGQELVGENTDGQGFVRSLRTVVDPAGASMVLFGAGGAARAVAVESALAGVEVITVVNRDPGRAASLVDLVDRATPARARQVVWDGAYAVPSGTSVVVNCTSVGLAPHGGDLIEVDLDSLGPGMLVADVVPNPPETRLLREAASRGAETLDGLGMLVEQGAIAIELWTGAEPDRAVMRETLERVFAG
jgi:shikimate dehydrogenase